MNQIHDNKNRYINPTSHFPLVQPGLLEPTGMLPKPATTHDQGEDHNAHNFLQHSALHSRNRSVATQVHPQDAPHPYNTPDWLHTDGTQWKQFYTNSTQRQHSYIINHEEKKAKYWVAAPITTMWFFKWQYVCFWWRRRASLGGGRVHAEPYHNSIGECSHKSSVSTPYPYLPCRL